MNRWSARRPLMIWLGLLLGVAVWCGAAWTGLQLANQLVGPAHTWPLTLRLFGLLVLTLLGFAGGAVLLYRMLSALTLRYSIDRNAVTIHWLGNRAVVPMDRIERVEVGVAVRQALFGRLLRYQRVTRRLADGTPVFLFATGPVSQTVALYTPTSVYAISPSQRDAFVQEIEGRRGLGVVQSSTETLIRTRRVSYPFWTDGLVRLGLLIGLGLNLGLWAIIASRYTEIAELVSIRFDATGAAVAVAPREQLLALPLIGLLVWLVNIGMSLLVYRASRVGAVLLLIGASVIQGLLAVALGHAMLYH